MKNVKKQLSVMLSKTGAQRRMSFQLNAMSSRLGVTPKTLKRNIDTLTKEGSIELISCEKKSNDIKYSIRDIRKLITKTRAMDILGVSRSEFEKLGVEVFSEVRNPHYRTAAPMQLYLLNEIENLENRINNK